MAKIDRMKGHHRREAMRNELLAEWRGGPELENLEKNIHHAGDHLAEILRLAGLRQNLEEEEVKNAWLAMAGDFVARHAEPCSIRNGDLVLRVTQPAMRFHLEQMKPVLLRRIQQHLGEDRVKSVKFTLG